jgi:hypothetical protein
MRSLSRAQKSTETAVPKNRSANSPCLSQNKNVQKKTAVRVFSFLAFGAGMLESAHPRKIENVFSEFISFALLSVAPLFQDL